jgi:hypothetical protein
MEPTLVHSLTGVHINVRLRALSQMLDPFGSDWHSSLPLYVINICRQGLSLFKWDTLRSFTLMVGSQPCLQNLDKVGSYWLSSLLLYVINTCQQGWSLP